MGGGCPGSKVKELTTLTLTWSGADRDLQLASRPAQAPQGYPQSQACVHMLVNAMLHGPLHSVGSRWGGRRRRRRGCPAQAAGSGSPETQVWGTPRPWVPGVTGLTGLHHAQAQYMGSCHRPHHSAHPATSSWQGAGQDTPCSFPVPRRLYGTTPQDFTPQPRTLVVVALECVSSGKL